LIRRLLIRLRKAEDGATVIEFAILAPTLLIMLFGLLDLAHNMYTAQMLQGAIQHAARNSTIEGASGRAASLDQMVTSAVRTIAPGSTLTFGRKAYTNFADVSRPEDFHDDDENGTCNDGELYEDANGNGNWDPDLGRTGFGGARDAVLYTVTVSYNRFFPIHSFIPGQSATQTMSTSTVLRNQPFGAQDVPTVSTATGTCT
jgi:TadE-like protein